MEAETLNEIKELFGELKLNLYERLSSPLMPSFIVSWMVVNYKLIVTIFSEGSFETKFDYIDSHLYSSQPCFWLLTLIYPLLGSLIYIFVLPYPARFVFGFSLNRKIELRQMKLTKEKATLLSQEDSNKLRLDNFELRRSIESLRRESEDEISLLRTRLKQFERPNLLPIGESSDVPQGAPEAVVPAKLLPEDQAAVLGALVVAANSQITGIDVEYLSKVLGKTITDVRSALDDLLEERLVYSLKGAGTSSGGIADIFELTREGRKKAKESHAIGDNASTGSVFQENKLENDISMDHVNALQALSNFENRAANPPTAVELAAFLKVQVTDVQIVIGDLKHFDYVSERTSMNGLTYSLTHEGRKCLKVFLKKIEDIRNSNK